MHIGTVETEVTATDPNLLHDPKFIARIVQMVKAELEQDALEAERRARDCRAGRQKMGR